MTTFATLQNICHFSRKRCLFVPRFQLNNFNVILGSFFACFWHFEFLPKIGHFLTILPYYNLCRMAINFCHLSKYCHFSIGRRFYEPCFALNNWNVILESFFVCRWHFEFQPQNRPFLTTLPYCNLCKKGHFCHLSKYSLFPIARGRPFLQPIFVLNNFNAILKSFFACFWHFEFQPQNGPFFDFL